MIKLDKNNFFTGWTTPTPARINIFLTQMMKHDLFALANRFVDIIIIIIISSSTSIKHFNTYHWVGYLRSR